MPSLFYPGMVYSTMKKPCAHNKKNENIHTRNNKNGMTTLRNSINKLNDNLSQIPSKLCARHYFKLCKKNSVNNANGF